MLKTWEAVQKILNKEGKENFIVKQLIINMKKIFHLTFLLIVSQLTSQQTPASLSKESILFIFGIKNTNGAQDINEIPKW